MHSLKMNSKTESPEENTTRTSPGGLTNTTPMSPPTLQQDRSLHAFSFSTSDGKSASFTSFSFSPNQRQQQEEQQHEEGNNKSNPVAPSCFTADASTGTAASSGNRSADKMTVILGEKPTTPVPAARTTNINDIECVSCATSSPQPPSTTKTSESKLKRSPPHNRGECSPYNNINLGALLNAILAPTGVVGGTTSSLSLPSERDVEADHLTYRAAAATARTNITGKTKGGEDYDDDDGESFSDFSDDDDDEHDEDNCDTSAVVADKVKNE